eukprot:4907929-Amphidinium_carterae.1
MMAEDRDARTGIPHANVDNPGTFVELKTKTEAMAKIAYQIFNKQKEYQREHQILLDKCNLLEEELAQAKRDAKIWAEQSRADGMKVIGLQRSISSYHARLTALEDSTRNLRTTTEDTDNMDDILGTHAGLIRRSTEETFQREEAQSYSSICRDNALSNRIAICEGRNHQLAALVHELYMLRARENNVPPAQRPVLRRVAPPPEDQHGVIVHGYTGTPAFRMYEPPSYPSLHLPRSTQGIHRH